MAGIKGQMHQITFVMVDETDFATVESAVVGASCTATFWGVNHGTSTAEASAVVSKAVAVMHSGIMRCTLKTTENNYDRMTLKITESDTGCAPQYVIWENETPKLLSELSDILSGVHLNSAVIGANVISDLSDILGAVIANSVLISDVQSQLDVTASKVLLIQSNVSDILVDTATLAGMSDTLSQVLVDTAEISDFESQFLSRVPKLVASQSLLSDVRSDLRSLVSTQGGTTVSAIWGIDASSISTVGSVGSLIIKTLDDMVPGMSDTLSKVLAHTSYNSGVLSDLNSRITGAIATKSDFVSAVWAVDASSISSANSIGSMVVNELDGLKTSELSDLRSDIRSLVSTQGGTTVSAIWGIDASSVSTVGSVGSLIVKALDDMVPGISDTLSQVLVDTATLAGMSNILSQVLIDTAEISDFESNLLSRIPKEVASKSLLSDVESNLRSLAVANHSDVRSLVSTQGGVTASQVWGIDASSVSTVNSIGSLIVKTLDDMIPGMSDTLSKVFADTAYNSGVLSDLDSRITGAIATKSDFVSAVWNANPSSISAASTIGSLIVKVLDDTLSDYHSDLRSLISGIGGGTASNIASVVWAVNPSSISGASTMGSLLVKGIDDTLPQIASDASDVASRITAAPATKSDLVSAIWAANASSVSTVGSIGSLVVRTLDDNTLSDLRSAIDGITASVSASDISDIASKVWAEKYHAHSLASSFGSLFSVVATGVDNTESRTLRTMSDTSDILVDTAALAGMSNILSQVLVDTAEISDFESNLLSRIPKEVASKSLLSDVRSDLRSQTSTVGGASASQVASAVWSINPSAISAVSTLGSLVVKTVDDLIPGMSDALSKVLVDTAALAGMSDTLSQVLVDTATLAGMSNTLSQVLVDTTEISDFESNLLSRIPKEVASKSLLSDVHSDLRSLTSGIGGGTASNIASAVWGVNPSSISAASTMGSLLVKGIDDTLPQIASDASDLASRITAAPATKSDLVSAIWAVNPSSISGASTIGSLMVKGIDDGTLSDITSKIQGIGGAASASAVASAVWSIDPSTINGLSTLGSMIVKEVDGLSDVLSQVLVDTAEISDFESNMLSRIPKEVASKSLLSDVESNLRSQTVAVQSDVRSLVSTTGGTSASAVASAVWAINPSTISGVSTLGSMVVKEIDGIDTVVDNIYSLLSDHDSNMQSRVTKEVASKSLLSNVDSDLRSYLTGMSGAISDIESQLDATDTVADNIYSLLSDHDSNMQSRVTKEVASKSLLSDVESNIRSVLLGISASVSDIESAIDALMGTDTLTELAAIPSATPTRDEALLYLYQYFRNKRTQTSSRLVMFKDDASTELASAIISADATTFTKGEFGTP